MAGVGRGWRWGGISKGFAQTFIHFNAFHWGVLFFHRNILIFSQHNVCFSVCECTYCTKEEPNNHTVFSERECVINIWIE